MRFTPLRSFVLVSLGLAGVSQAQGLRPLQQPTSDLIKDYFFQETEDGIVAADVTGT